MNRKIRMIFICSCLLIGLGVRAQQIDSLMEIYNAKVPQEKVYVQFDNSIYTPGQTIWYKAYLMSGIDPSTVSKTFYIDWFDDKGKLLKRVTAPIINAGASGSYTIPDNITSGHIQVLAYTKWMLNFDSSFLFHKTIPVTQKNTIPVMNKVMPVTRLQFFPEGGELVNGLTSSVAFKITSGGLPVAIEGKIKNKNGQTVTDFHTSHNGMGRFALIPESGEEYTAEWKDARGETQLTKLPNVQSSGIVLSMVKREKWMFSVERREEDQRLKKVMIVGSMYQQVLFRAVVNLSKTKAISSLPSDKFPSGVLRVTVMDMDMKPLAERIVFINNNEYRIDAKVNADTLNTSAHGKNVFEIDWPDTSSASLSLAITDEDHHTRENNIISGLLLSPEIKGTVYDPSYYFSSNHDSVLNNLDLVMMTNGWRRFAWDHVLAGTTPPLPNLRDSNYLSLSGKISNISESRLKKADMLNMILVGKDSTKQLVFTELHADGSFHEDNMVLFDTVKIYYQFNKSSIPAKSAVKIGNNFMPVDTSRRLPAIDQFLPDTTGMARILFLAAEQKKMDSLKATATLKEVIVKTKARSKMQEMEDLYTSSLFKTMNATEFDFTNDVVAQSSMNVFAYLQARVAGLIISNATSTNPTAKRRGQDVSFFLNEIQVDASGMTSVPVSDIAYVKVINPPFYGAPGGGAGGAIAVYTKKGGDAISGLKGMDHTLMPGYSPVKEFYVADPAEQKGAFPKADLRRTLYWNPNIIPDAQNKKIKVTFYNNDISNTMQVILEGVADDGRLIHYTKLLK